MVDEEYAITEKGIKVQRIIDDPNKKSYKVWSDKLQRYYYKSKDPNYYKDYFHKSKKELTCDICGTVVTCQLYSHKKSNKCRVKQNELKIKQLEQALEEFNKS